MIAVTPRSIQLLTWAAGLQMEVPRQEFKGKPVLDAVTGEQTLFYAAWKRWPKVRLLQCERLHAVYVRER